MRTPKMQSVPVPFAAPEARRGRPRSFDVEAVTAAALRVLWRQGYEATSIDQLVDATGLSPSSLYGTFGSKRGVFHAALERYDRNMDAVLEPLANGTGGMDDVIGFLARVRASVASPSSPGCFMVNTTTEMAPRDPDIAERTRRYQQRIRTSLHAALARAATSHDIEASTVEDRARIVQASLFGALVAARGGDTGEALAALDALRREAQRWRAAAR
jgi:AcrR family transcriptional regulator